MAVQSAEKEVLEKFEKINVKDIINQFTLAKAKKVNFYLEAELMFKKFL